jgi:hypothetical protein
MNDIHPLLTAMQAYQNNMSIQSIRLQTILNRVKDQEGDWIPTDEIPPEVHAAIMKLAKYLSTKEKQKS